jgi:hypothetical protein
MSLWMNIAIGAVVGFLVVVGLLAWGVALSA